MRQILVLLPLLLAGCALSTAPYPIMPGDLVKDADAAKKIAAAKCFPNFPWYFFEAKLIKNKWDVSLDMQLSHLSTTVAKSDGAVGDCNDLEI